jgi:hypothetical protein
MKHIVLLKQAVCLGAHGFMLIFVDDSIIMPLHAFGSSPRDRAFIIGSDSEAMKA